MMASSLVVDASAAISFLAWEEQRDSVKTVLSSRRSAGDAIVVPSFFWLEVVNALAGRRKWPGARVLEAVAELDAFELQTLEQDRALVVLAIDLVERHRLIVYDASYLALAIQFDAQLLTLDQQLANAAGARAIALDGSHQLSDGRPTYERQVTWPDYRGASAYLARLRSDTLTAQ